MNANKNKLVIKPYKPASKSTMEADVDTEIREILESVQVICEERSATQSFEALFRKVHNLVVRKSGDRVHSEIFDFLKTFTLSVAQKVFLFSDNMLLDDLAKLWSQHRLVMTTLRDNLLYLDREYNKQNRKMPNFDALKVYFRDFVIRDARVNTRLNNSILSRISSERNGERVDQSILKRILAMLVELGIGSRDLYVNFFEREFLEQSGQFYQIESNAFISNNSCGDYIEKVQKRLAEEEARVQNYLDVTTGPKLLDVCLKELVSKHAQFLVEMEKTGCNYMFDENRIADLRRMYLLFARTSDSLQHLRTSLFDYVRRHGLELYKDEEKLNEPTLFIKELLELKGKFDGIVRDAFDNDKDFQRSLKEGLEAVVNVDERCSQFLAHYSDDLMKQKKQDTDEEMNKKLDSIVSLFRFLQDKDIFESFYKTKLANRLLQQRSTSSDNEKAMISKLKAECGYQFSAKLEGMFRDLKSSSDLCVEYKKSDDYKGCTTGIDLNPTVLTKGFWPSQNVKQCKLDTRFLDTCSSFENFYHNVSGFHERKLHWSTNLGTADLRCFFGKFRCEASVSTYQMVILMEFNDNLPKTFSELETATQIEKGELKRHILSLSVNEKFRFLKKSGGKGFSEEDSFSVNPAFTSKIHKFKIPLIVSKETISTVLPSSIEEDRRNMIEAAIVRIMKARKSLDHNNLVAEVTKQLSSRFRPDPLQIKKRIENLMEREYLERDPDSNKMYRYVA